MKIKLKVCGMRHPANIGEVALLHPDYMGFIFYEKSKRFVGRDFILPVNTPATIKRVGVFVNENMDTILSAISKYQLNYVQLHGDESPNDCSKIKEQNVGVIKAFSVDEDFDFEATERYADLVDFFLFDTKTESYGGSGKVFDWKLLKKYNQRVPFFLSGGISPGNIHEVKTLIGMNLHAIDINSGVETEPGIKCVDKIETIKNTLNSKP